MKAKLVAIGAGLLLSFTALMWAQQGNSEIGGVVRDSSGSPIPGASVSVVNQETGTSRRQILSGDDGGYLITNLPPGLYQVTVEMSGFKTHVQTDLRLNVGIRQSLDIELQVGQITDSITVTGGAPLVETTSKEVGGVVSRQELVELPSVNRNFVGFVGLLPGVLPNISTESFGSDAVSVNGQDRRNASFLIDGVSNNDDVIGQRAGGQTRVALETVQEFQVITNQFDAEFGRTSGAVINAITKSGTNDFHGSAFGFFQDSALDAHNFFANAIGRDKPETSLQQFGGTVGGPVVKDYAHFFFSVERVLIDEGVVINIEERPEFNDTVAEETKAWNTVLKGDVQLTDSNLLSVRWLREDSPQFNQIINQAGGRPVTLNAAREESDTDQNWVGTLTSTLNPTLINQFRFGVTREDVAFANPAFNSGTPQENLPPLLLFDSFADGNSDVAQGRINTNWQADEVISWVTGNHDIRFGAQYQYATTENFNSTRLNGRFSFPGDAPFNPNDPFTFPNRLSIRVGGPQENVVVNHNIGLFLQDKWQLNPNFTLNLGLRWDKETVTEDNNNISPRVGFAYSPGDEGRTVIRAGFGLFYDRTPFSVIGAFTTDARFVGSFITAFPLNGRDIGPENGEFPTDPTLVNGPTVDRALIESLFPTGTLLRNSSPTVDNTQRSVPYVATYNVGVQHQLADNLVFEADYIHSDGIDQLVGIDLNNGFRDDPASGAVLGRADPNISTLTTRVSEGSTDYDSLRLSLNKRFAAGYSFRASYTLGHSRGDTTGDLFANAPFQAGNVGTFTEIEDEVFDLGLNADSLNLDRNEGRTNLDVRHNFVFSGTWEVPRVDGFSISSVIRTTSGFPFTLTNSRLDADLNGINFDFLAPGTYRGTGATPFETDFDGERNGATGPNAFQADVRLQYKHTFREEISGAFIFEIFNLTNRTNFQNPRSDFASTTGTPSGSFLNLFSAGIPRTLQLGFRVTF